jgi:hypothetical protein
MTTRGCVGEQSADCFIWIHLDEEGNPMTGTSRLKKAIDDYKSANQALLSSNPDFANWLENRYVPIAGGWQY